MNCVIPDEPICRLPNGVEIRSPREEDAPSFSKHGTDPKVWNQMSDRIPHPYTLEHALGWVAVCRDKSQCAPTGNDREDADAVRVPTQYVIAVEGEVCGAIGLTLHDGHKRLSATLGYWLGAAYWRRGIMSAVVPAFVQWTWDTFGYLIRLHGTAYEFNVGSQAVMKKAGFVQEGICKNACIKLGVIHNEVWLGAVRPGIVAFAVQPPTGKPTEVAAVADILAPLNT